MASRFAPAVLDRLTAALTRHKGPQACVIVAKAADQALDVYQLAIAVALVVPMAERDRFLEEIDDVLRPGRLQSLTPSLLAQATRRLAEHIGPVARVLVQREARTATDAGQLYARLAQHIDDLAARQAFIATSPR